MIEKEMASGISASATTSPARISVRATWAKATPGACAMTTEQRTTGTT